ncbi:hypothetical protein JL100_030380 (plasmid) [Skermanella mucosa]|uniref:hypothetical protein n=1 Tax=Skermanella mucosa TaxID=1789672 RepID=UPI00192AF367
MHLTSTTAADTGALLALVQSRDLTQDDAAEIAEAAQDRPEILRELIHNAHFWRDHSRNEQTRRIAAGIFEALRRDETQKREAVGMDLAQARGQTIRLSTFDLLYPSDSEPTTSTLT